MFGNKKKVKIGGFWNGLFGGENKTIVYDKTWTGRSRKTTYNHKNGSKKTRTKGHLWGHYHNYSVTCRVCKGAGIYKSPNYKGKKPAQSCRACNGTGTYTK